MAVALTSNVDWDLQTGASTTMSYASGKTIASGATLAIFAYWGDSSVTATVADNLGNTYTLVDDVAQASGIGTRRGRSFYAKNVTGGGSYTPVVTFSGSTNNRVLLLAEMTGADTVTPLVGNAGQAQTLPGTGTNAITSTADTPTANNCLVLGCTSGDIRQSIVVGTGFTDVGMGFGVGAAGNIEWLRGGYLIQTTATSQAATFTQATGDDPNATLTLMMQFQPASSAAFSLVVDTASYAVTGSDVTLLQQVIQTWLRVGR